MLVGLVRVLRDGYQIPTTRPEITGGSADTRWVEGARPQSVIPQYALPRGAKLCRWQAREFHKFAVKVAQQGNGETFQSTRSDPHHEARLRP